jgi:branched-chain amino acid transport system ATP-binding protein
MPDRGAALLEIAGLDAGYGDFQALFGVALRVEAGQVVSVIGANGAGKSTLLKSIAGLLSARREAVRFRGEPIGGLAANAVVARGIALVPEGRRLFASLSVEENLLVGSTPGRPGPWSLDRVYRLFPVLAERRRQPSQSLSGGQQQMVAIGRALMSNPDLLLCDEISLGLAPILVRDIYAHLGDILAEGTAALIVEQDIAQALKVADRVICLQEGRVVLDRPAAEATRADVARAYFGV